MTRFAYLGTSTFAAAVLRGLAAGPHEPVLVVTRPDAPKGRGRKLTPPPIAHVAQELGIELFQPQDINAPESVERIEAAAPQELVVCAFGALIGEPLLTRYAPLNVHPSLLPRWRGAAPIERALMAGDRETGVSIITLVEELDAGPIGAQAVEPITPEDNYGTLHPRLEALAVELLDEVLTQRPEFVAQAESGITYAEKITAADRTLDPARPAQENVNIVRALSPHIGARLALEDGTFLGVHEAAANTDGSLQLIRVQPAGGRPMAYTDYARGHGEAR
ncbi:MAG TPA: methionyl-tRNA formyltransferase [Baekduia sp.]|nr:methionyl-tRNA formyltransferase [Baekduia sp.]